MPNALERHAAQADALRADIQAIKDRIQRQVAEDPDHVVALAMYQADLRRASIHLSHHLANPPMELPPMARRYSDGLRVA